MAGLKLLEFFQRFQVHIAQVADLLPQLVDLLLDLVALALHFRAGLLLQSAQLYAVVLAQAVGQGGAFQADFVGRQLGLVNGFVELAHSGAGLLRCGRRLGPRCLRRVALLDELADAP